MKFALSNLKFIPFICLIVLYAAVNFSAQKPAETPVAPPQIFRDISDESGLNFRHFNGMTGKMYLPEIMGSGSAFFDYDNDGDLDVFVLQGKVIEPNVAPDKTIFPWKESEPPTARLFRNDLTIEKDGSRTVKFTDVTKKSGIVADGYGFGAATGDINNDGFIDLYVCNFESNKLFLNNGDGTFTDITAKSKTDDPRWSIGASFLDYDRDGWLDLVVINYSRFDIENQPKCYSLTSARDYCGPKSFEQVGNSLFRNKGDGTFENVTVSSGIGEKFGHALGVVAGDFNDDGWLDIYIANDGDPNDLWMNQKNGKFENEGLMSGAAVSWEGKSEASMGIAAGDFNQDGTEDLFITHLMEETHTLYKNAGDAFFDDITPRSRVGLPDSRLTGFGTYFIDYDNDCLLDIFVANGAVKLIKIIDRPGNTTTFDRHFPLGQLNQLFRNNGNETFEDISAKAGDAFSVFEVSRGASFGDIDNDGDTDVLVVNNNGRARLLSNQVGTKNRWIGLKLIGKDGKRDALGAKIEIHINEKSVLHRRVRTDGSYSSAHDPRVLVGLGKYEKIEKLRVIWTDGKVEEWKNPTVDRYTNLTQGSAARGEK